MNFLWLISEAVEDRVMEEYLTTVSLEYLLKQLIELSTTTTNLRIQWKQEFFI